MEYDSLKFYGAGHTPLSPLAAAVNDDDEDEQDECLIREDDDQEYLRVYDSSNEAEETGQGVCGTCGSITTVARLTSRHVVCAECVGEVIGCFVCAGRLHARIREEDE